MAYQPHHSRNSSPSVRRGGSSGHGSPMSPLTPGLHGSHRSLELGGGSPASPRDPYDDDDDTPTTIQDLLKLEELGDEEQIKYAAVPLIGAQKLIIDDDSATYVIIFPRQKDQYGDGTIDPNKMRENPRAVWEKIFKNVASKREGFPISLKRGPMPEGDFQELVRMKFLMILQDSGLKAVSLESIDKDEVFLKIELDINGPMIRDLAEHFHYRMPFKRECYEKEHTIGSFEGGRPMTNDDGVEVFAYADYRDMFKNKLQPFRKIDEVRLIILLLNSYVSMNVMQKEGIITRHFPGADYKTIMMLHSDWADWQNVFLVPSSKDEGTIRNYFGEEIAFFFRWLGMYTRMLGGVAIVGLCTTVRHLPGLDFTAEKKDFVKIMFGFMMVMWEAYLLKKNKASSARAEQAWGMTSFAQNEPALPSYDKSLEGTQGLKLRQAIGAAAVIVYLLFFMSVIAAVSYWFYQATIEGRSQYGRWQPYVQSILIKVLSFVWRKISYYIVIMQNHRTQSRFNDALTMNLSMVKLFVALWPFFYLALVKAYTEQTCADTLSESAHTIYRHIGWPQGLAEGDIGGSARSKDQIPIADFGFLQGYWHIKGNKTCIEGCYPVACERNKGKLYCQTNCLMSIQDSLKTLYIIQVASSMVFILIPIVLTWYAVYTEMEKAKKMSGGSKKPSFSFIQLQAKCHDVAPYFFQQWGGSYVEDFLDVAVGYALLACFGICYPAMPVIGFLCMLVQYRLLAYRMTNVTCRPEPRGSGGIGLFEEVFESISILSVFFNVLLAVRLLLPCRNYPFWKQLIIFIVAEKSVFLLRSIADVMIPSTPQDVTLIEDFNNEFKKTLSKRKEAATNETESYDEVDIGIYKAQDEDGNSSDGSSDSSPLAWVRMARLAGMPL